MSIRPHLLNIPPRQAEFVSAHETDGDGRQRVSNRLLGAGTKPFCLSMADEGAGKRGESEMEVSTALIADGQSAESGQPRQPALDDPAIAAEPFAALDAEQFAPSEGDEIDD